MKNIITLFIICISLIPNKISSQTFINGDFENNTSLNCDYNNTDVIFNQKVSNVYAFGMGYAGSNGGYVGEIDIQTFGCFINPQNGSWRLGLSSDLNEPTSDSITIELTSSLIIGETYELTFHLFGNVEFDNTLANIDIGESLNPDEFGILIDTFSPNNDSWKEISVIFTATQESNYISVRNEIGGDGWNQVDNFSITLSNLSIDESNQKINFLLYPNPATSSITLDFKQNISSGLLTIYDLSGKSLSRKEINNESFVSLDLNNIPSGVYFIKLDFEKKSDVFKFLKN